MAHAEKSLRSKKIVFAFMGDGTLGEGVVYESLNMASLWRLPILFILENNRYAQTTPIELHLAGRIADRFTAFGITTDGLDTVDVLEIKAKAQEVVQAVRKGDGPHALILQTYRYAPHSKGDDTRDPEEIAHFRKHDPLVIQAERLESELRNDIEEQAGLEVEEAFQQAETDPFPDPIDLTPPLDHEP
jgi:TPP-dependent pyruvate/acetoin dehydrogenase alpha subunit